MTINERKSILAFYISKYNDNALDALGYRDGITAAIHNMSEIVTEDEGIANNYLKQRRDEFDVFFDNGRAGYRNRKPTKVVQKMYENWNSIEFSKFTDIAKSVLENIPDNELMRIEDAYKIMSGLQS